MLRTCLVSYFLLIISFALAQAPAMEKDTSTAPAVNQLVFTTTPDEARSLARIDLTNGEPYLILPGSLAPVVYASEPRFEEAYQVRYYYRGCTGAEYTLVAAYNEVVLDHLQQYFSRRWRRLIRRDVIGFRDWRRSRR
ncbi:MAG: hypothetical protein KDC54_11430 [Lewinella sp.]|nr:hypothetical protein [Lewinella sp.]